MRWLVLLLFSALALAQPLPGNEPPPDLSPRVFEIAGKLRCPVCQGESIAESNAAISQESRRQIAEMLAAGKSEQEILDYFVARYGEWILYAPPKKGVNWLLWFAPALGVLVIALALWRYLVEARRREALLGIDDKTLEEIERRLEEE